MSAAEPPPRIARRRGLLHRQTRLRTVALYYYLVAIVAVGFVIGGTIASVMALRVLAWPDPGSVTRASTRFLLHGLAFALPGAVSAWWHLGQAKRREGIVAPGASWGRSLYVHGVAFIAYIVALGGVAVTLFLLIDVVLPPPCPSIASFACNDSEVAVRAVANGVIVVLVAGTVWWWHLREGSRTVSS